MRPGSTLRIAPYPRGGTLFIHGKHLAFLPLPCPGHVFVCGNVFRRNVCRLPSTLSLHRRCLSRQPNVSFLGNIPPRASHRKHGGRLIEATGDLSTWPLGDFALASWHQHSPNATQNNTEHRSPPWSALWTISPIPCVNCASATAMEATRHKPTASAVSP